MVDLDMVQIPTRKGSGNGCLGAVLFMIVLGVAFVCAGYFVGGDFTTYNPSTGQRDAFDTSAYWLGGVCTLLGLTGGVIMFLGRNNHDQPTPRS